MLFRKKTEIEVETSQEDEELFINKLVNLAERYDNLGRYLRLNIIDSKRFHEEEKIISDEIAELEKEKNLKAFDDMMGSPMDMLKELFDDRK